MVVVGIKVISVRWGAYYFKYWFCEIVYINGIKFVKLNKRIN